MQLRDYQTAIANKASALLGTYKIAYLSMQVRTGKTLTALHTAELYGASRVLFLTPKKVIDSIEKDADMLGRPFSLIVTNYEQLAKFQDEGFDLIICDEAHRLAQFPTPAKRTQLLKNIARGLPIIFLSGSPSPESFSQLYHQFWVSSFSPFAEWPTFYKWASLFVTKKVKYLYNREIADYSDANKEAIDKFCRHLFISYTQAAAGIDDELDEQVLTVKMKNSTYWLATRLMRDKVYIGKEGQELVADTAVKLMNKMHQIYSGTVLFEDGTAAAFDHSKAEYIRDRFHGEKIAIFYKFKAELQMLRWVFGARTTDDPAEFAASDTLTFVSQIQSGREGINLSTADAIVFLNIDFSAVSYLQARARLQAKGRTKANKIFWVFAENGIEPKIYEKVKAKEDFTLSYFNQVYGIKRERHPGADNKAALSERMACGEGHPVQSEWVSGPHGPT